MSTFKEYKVIRITESGCSAMLWGAAILPLEKNQ